MGLPLCFLSPPTHTLSRNQHCGIHPSLEGRRQVATSLGTKVNETGQHIHGKGLQNEPLTFHCMLPHPLSPEGHCGESRGEWKTVLGHDRLVDFD